jgi:hypothetical protein
VFKQSYLHSLEGETAIGETYKFRPQSLIETMKTRPKR